MTLKPCTSTLTIPTFHHGPLEATLTTVDGRYNFSADAEMSSSKIWQSLRSGLVWRSETRSHEPLDAGFLERYFSDEDLGGVAVLVTDDHRYYISRSLG